jgi:hypothetical protein
MITIDQEFYSSPYYFFLRDKGKNYSLYLSAEETLTEARKKDVIVKIPKSKLKKVQDYLEKLLKDKKKKSTDELKGEIEELVNLDGALSNSKLPILDPRLHPKKTMDQTVAASRITNDPITRGYRTYYGESKEEVKEIDFSDAFGYEETEDLDGKKTYKKLIDMGIEPEEAVERTKQFGKDPSGKKDKKSKYKKDPNFIAKMTISEIQKQKMIKMVEDMLAKKSDPSSADVTKKEVSKTVDDLPLLLKKNVKSLLKQAEKQGLSKKDLIKILQGE